MNKIYYAPIALLVFIISFSNNALAHFGSKGPYGGTITCTAQGTILGSATPSVYFGTENGGVYVNSNATLVGWSAKPVGLKSGKISALSVTGSYVFAATADSGIYRFTGFVGSDRYWQKMNNGLGNLKVTSLVSIDTITLIAGTDNGTLYKTIDKGATWTALTSLPFGTSKITGLLKAGTRIIAIAETKGVFASDNDGSTWSSLNDGNTNNIIGTTELSYNATTDELLVLNNNGIYILPSASTTNAPVYTIAITGLPLNIEVRHISNSSTNWYLATDNGVYTSLVGSVSWSTINTGLNTMLNVNVVTKFSTSLFAGINDEGIYKTDATTINWAALNTGFNNQETFAIATSGAQVIVVATAKGVSVSKNLATSYTLSNNGLTDYLHVTDLEFFGSKLFATTMNGGVFMSADTGAVWTAFNSGVTATEFTKVFASTNYVYVFDVAGNIFQSNGVLGWTSVQTGLPNGVEPVSLTFAGSKAILGAHGQGVFSRNEASGDWIAINDGLPTDHITAVTSLGTKIYAGTHGNGVFVSDADDINWTACAPLSISHTTLIGLDGSEVQAMNTFGGYVFASYRGGLLATNDHGQTWVQGGNQFNLPSYTAVNKIAFVTSRVFVTTEYNCVYSNALSEVAINVAINYPTSPSCVDATDGSLTAVGTGGTAPYTYLWSTGATTQAVSGLGAGTYYVTITDAVFATRTDSMTIVGTPAVTPTIAVLADVNPTCAGGAVTFSATPEFEGTTPSYQWKVNGTNAGTGTSFTSSSLANNDIVTCELTSNQYCVTSTSATSNSVTMTVSSSLVPSVLLAITDGANPSCEGATIEFSANPTNGGNTPAYIWYLNGEEVGTNASTFISSSLVSTDVVTCTLVSNLTCATEDSVDASGITLTVNPIPATAIISANGTVLTSSVVAGNQWFQDGNPISGATSQTYTVTENGSYSVEVTQNGCSSLSSAVIAFTTLGLNYVDLNESGISIYPNPSNGTFSILILDETNEIYSIVIYSEVGMKVQEITENLGTNMNVSSNLLTGVYFLKINSSKGSSVQKLIIE